jgi:hypothetical protein
LILLDITRSLCKALMSIGQYDDDKVHLVV